MESLRMTNEIRRITLDQIQQPMGSHWTQSFSGNTCIQTHVKKYIYHKLRYYYILKYANDNLETERNEIPEHPLNTEYCAFALQ